jgi:hypothetical protein
MPLVRTCVIVRNHNDQKIINFQNEIIANILSHSIRDQLCFNYIMEKNNYNINIIERQIFEENYKVYPHIKIGIYDGDKFKESIGIRLLKIKRKLLIIGDMKL